MSSLVSDIVSYCCVGSDVNDFICIMCFYFKENWAYPLCKICCGEVHSQNKLGPFISSHVQNCRAHFLLEVRMCCLPRIPISKRNTNRLIGLHFLEPFFLSCLVQCYDHNTKPGPKIKQPCNGRCNGNSPQ